MKRLFIELPETNFEVFTDSIGSIYVEIQAEHGYNGVVEDKKKFQKKF